MATREKTVYELKVEEHVRLVQDTSLTTCLILDEIKQAGQSMPPDRRHILIQKIIDAKAEREAYELLLGQYKHEDYTTHMSPNTTMFHDIVVEQYPIGHQQKVALYEIVVAGRNAGRAIGLFQWANRWDEVLTNQKHRLMEVVADSNEQSCLQDALEGKMFLDLLTEEQRTRIERKLPQWLVEHINERKVQGKFKGDD